MTAIELKDLGNKFFSARKYEDAISCYSKAIIKSPLTAAYFTNRALCYLKLQQWELACQDCRRALELDSSSVKGHFFLGQALQEMKYYDKAVKHLQRASDLAREQKLNFGDDISCQLRMARKRRWQLLEEKRLQQENELKTYLNELILADKQKRVQEMKVAGARPGDIERVESALDKYISDLKSIFAQVDEKRRRVDHLDPVTRTQLTEDQLIPNLTMKEVVELADAFLVGNESALY
ncbi:E3 ubiquitin-protein ligase CHIP-like isoform X1 [Haemaphysalis longicornis]